MKKLYDKNELLFAIGAIIVYVVLASNGRAAGDESTTMLLILAALTAAILVFLKSCHLFGKYGLTKMPEGKRFLYFVPFWLLGISNLFLGIAPHYSGLAQVRAVCSMALVGFLEEIIFRGFLFEAIARENRKRAILISALTFGMGHIVNLLTGSATMETLLQIVYASAIGFAFVIAYDRSGSLWPCIVAHSLIDMTSKFSNDASPYAETANTVTIICILILSIGYAVYMIRKCPGKE